MSNQIVLASTLVKDQAWWKKMEGTTAHLLKGASRIPQFIAVAQRLLVDIPKLQQATAHSFAAALFQAAVLDLMPGGFSGECFLIPYDDKNAGKTIAQFQMGYFGFIRLASRVGITMRPQFVHQKDKYDIQEGSNPHFHVWPAYGTDRGPVILCAALGDLPEGRSAFAIHDRKEAERRRKRSASARSGKQSPWDTDYEAMWLKGTFRDLGKFITHRDAILLNQVARADEYVEKGVAFTPGDTPEFVESSQAAASEVAPETSGRSSVAVPADSTTVVPKEWTPKSPTKKCVIMRTSIADIERVRNFYKITDANGDEYTTFDTELAAPLDCYRDIELMIAYQENPGKNGKVYKNLKCFKALDEHQKPTEDQHAGATEAPAQS